MKKDIADKWVADLRAHPELQGRGALETDDGKFCCLGRLHVVLGLPTRRGPDWDEGRPCNQIMEVLTTEARCLAEMKSDDGDLPLGTGERLTDIEPNWRGGLRHKTVELSTLNDDGATFAQIADIIEQYWEDL